MGSASRAGSRMASTKCRRKHEDRTKTGCGGPLSVGKRAWIRAFDDTLRAFDDSW